ncbi:MAG: hypothetical protein ACJA0N_001390 [Pseudohongiellaceae bacterium]|jgi:hypothetical protein
MGWVAQNAMVVVSWLMLAESVSTTDNLVLMWINGSLSINKRVKNIKIKD